MRLHLSPFAQKFFTCLKQDHLGPVDFGASMLQSGLNNWFGPLPSASSASNQSLWGSLRKLICVYLCIFMLGILGTAWQNFQWLRGRELLWWQPRKDLGWTTWGCPLLATKVRQKDTKGATKPSHHKSLDVFEVPASRLSKPNSNLLPSHIPVC